MIDRTVIEFALLAVSSSLGFSIAFWVAIGLARFLYEGIATRSPGRPRSRLTIADVAVIIPAHNEEVALPKSIGALRKVIPADQIYVASDGSADRTVAVAVAMGCRILDIQPNRGKARALEMTIEQHGLCDAYRAILIQDADAEIDPHYFEHALPLFDDPRTVVVAGHVFPQWQELRAPRWNMVFTAYRTRLYRIVQAAFQYGQSWLSVSYIAPGVASMYRTSALRQIDIASPGLVIEDFNMTFEVHHKKLGRIAYTPRARCACEDPLRLVDYRKQVQRWYLGLWQTVWRHGIWPGRFWLALAPLLAELVVFCLFSLALPVLALIDLVVGIDVFAFSITDFSVHAFSPVNLFVGFLAVDYGLTVVVAITDRRPSLLVYGLAFPLLRLLDSALFLQAFVRSFSVRSDGRWTSPARHASGAAEMGSARLAISKGDGR